MSAASPKSRFNIFWAFLLGSAAIVLVRELLSEFAGLLWGASIAAAVAVLVMILHGIFRAHEPDQDRLADDTYYLGLLFTLVSLIYGLVMLFLFDQEGDLNERTNNLIGSFGIGLISTLVGILGRVWLQGRGTEDSSLSTAVAHATDDGLGEALVEHRGQVREATSAMAHFTRITLSEADQTRTHIRRIVATYQRELQQSADQALKQATQTWEQVNERIAPLCDTLEKTESAFSALCDAMQASAEQQRSAAEQTAEALKAACSEASEQIQSEAVTASQETGNQIRSHATQFSDSWQTLLSQLAPLQASIAESAREYTEFAKSIRAQTQLEHEHSERLAKQSRETFAASAQTVKAEALAAWRDASNQVSIPAEALVNAAKSAHDSLSQGQASVQALIEQIETSNDALKLLSEEVTAARANLNLLNAGAAHTSNQLTESAGDIATDRRHGESTIPIQSVAESVRELSEALHEASELVRRNSRESTERSLKTRILRWIGR